MAKNVNLMRSYVSDLYDGPRWKRKVERMHDGQVMAIYFREKEKEAEKRKAEKKKGQSGDIPF